MATTAHEIATELRKLADAFDKEPELVVLRTPFINFGCKYGLNGGKKGFLNIARLLPRPIAKEWSDEDLNITHKTNGLHIYANIERNLVCEVVEPAKPAVYRCESILSDEELQEVSGDAL